MLVQVVQGLSEVSQPAIDITPSMDQAKSWNDAQHEIYKMMNYAYNDEIYNEKGQTQLHTKKTMV